MPQMAPLSWLILFCLFTLSFFIFTVMNYFNKFFTNNNKNLNKTMMNNNNNNEKLNWKW
uniref:ATP synthase complex subunit 8 n=1 Tax=Thienemanniella tusimufegea TaxID=3072307 RepID=A0AA51M7B1_9DIPT|nr:ATP synthase F0 subunit 8 [Thienemanniella tusimufegea]WML69359.1 ATP synthase F0 subunit 8 [Thienemanniella tusimufegea]